MEKGALARKDVLGSMMLALLILQIIILNFISFLVLLLLSYFFYSTTLNMNYGLLISFGLNKD